GLVLCAGLTWRQAALLRAYSRYLRQIGTAFGQDYIQRVLLTYPAVVGLLVELFGRLFDPEFPGDREAHAAEVAARIRAALDAVPVLDHDRILRSFLALIGATLRTTAFQAEDELDSRAMAFKIDSRALPDMPLPVPLVEIWVSSPRVEGVHLRFGRVARGGLRWSDRREDFRTEILGLVKAQEVKNAVIVPVGAKGGFVPASLPDPARDREGWLAAGTAAYREFVAALLDLTDDLHGELVVPPAGVVRRDGDDPYLVVAADKGTASFSDIANAIAVERGYWLGDAFASGGSRGYDHKAMGITARGAWISVQRHFRELGINTQTDPFTVVGIGDMSGDVFGNGMMLSGQIRLVAAFDHRDILIDPDPDASRSLDERIRLFGLPRSSWADFDASVISAGGGVFSRSAKSIELSLQACTALGLDGTQRVFTPNEVIRSILRAPVDLLWNGGIGTYVKASGESNAQVGDKANDAIRIDGAALRCRVVGEGGNLGFTQLGRVEAAKASVRINSDAIDNSAGVDTSDHEVNLKILLDAMVRGGEISEDRRNAVLTDLTDEVAADVLADNYAQNVVLGNARAAALVMLPVHQRMIRDLERRGLLDRAVEFLPSDEEIELRRINGQGLTSPELSVLLAYSKISLMGDLNASSMANDPWYASALDAYFPAPVVRDFPAAVARHQLRSQIITTVVCNEVINTGGITFVYRACEETSASPSEVVHAARAASEIFGIQGLTAAVQALDYAVPTAAQDALNLGIRRLLDRATRWILHAHGDHLSPQDVVARYRPVVEQHADYVRKHLPEGIDEAVLATAARSMALGAPADLAHEVAALLDVYALLDIADVAGRTGVDPARIIPLYFAVIESYGINTLFLAITALPRTDRWAMLARQALRADLYSTAAALAENVLRMDQGSTALTLAAWEGHYASSASRAKSTLLDIAAVEAPDLATLSVALRVLRSLVVQTREA
ncbi:MAG: NAD-glutamate dehydrogenase, partial [Candidatus Nanopelagicales bacterium]|nr:NAD-glutamate dehydrogenase [Candidatus Nanopelagicales bacterium]